MQQRNPDFDDGVVIWSDKYSGRYQPVAYSEQFDGQWRLFLERQPGFHEHTGVETTDEYIDDRIYELTGERNYLLRRRFGPLAPLIAKWTGRAERVAAVASAAGFISTRNLGSTISSSSVALIWAAGLVVTPRR